VHDRAATLCSRTAPLALARLVGSLTLQEHDGKGGLRGSGSDSGSGESAPTLAPEEQAVEDELRTRVGLLSATLAQLTGTAVFPANLSGSFSGCPARAVLTASACFLRFDLQAAPSRVPALDDAAEGAAAATAGAAAAAAADPDLGWLLLASESSSVNCGRDASLSMQLAAASPDAPLVVRKASCFATLEMVLTFLKTLAFMGENFLITSQRDASKVSLLTVGALRWPPATPAWPRPTWAAACCSSRP
jgi:hypothetical protein